MFANKHSLFGTARGSNPGPVDPKSDNLTTTTPPMLVLKNEVNLELYLSDSSHYLILFVDVDKAIRELKPGKRGGYIGLTSGHIINACNELFVYISLLLSGFMVHGVVSENLCGSTIVGLPIPKGKIPIGTVSSNYRAIALSSIIGKILDMIALNKYCDELATSRSQFGFKNKHSTAMCVRLY